MLGKPKITSNVTEIPDIPEEIRLRRSQEMQRAHDIVTRLKYSQKYSSHLFRGVSNIDYGLIPSIARNRYKESFSKKDEKIIFSSVKNEGLMFVERGDMNDIDFLALAQHHGAPTRLLDWTNNPLVALYFAIFRGKLVDDERDGIVYVYQAKNKEFIVDNRPLNLNNDDIALFPPDRFSGRIGFIRPRFIDARIRNQSGLFSIQADPQVSFIENCDRKRLWKVLVPKEVKVALAKYLFHVGVTHDLIMPDFGGFCSHLTYKYHYNVGVRSTNLQRPPSQRHGNTSLPSQRPATASS